MRRETGIVLVHAVHETAPMAAMLPLYSVEAFAEVGRRLTDEAASLVRDLAPDLDVRTSVKGGTRVGVLVDAAEHASVVVLGHRPRSLTGRVFSHSTTTGVAARAHCPVVSVPDTWEEETVHGRVVVGVAESEASHDALDVGFSEARRRNARLVALHAWRLPTAYDDIDYSRIAIEEWMTSAKEEMEKALAPFREVYPDVTVETELRHDYAGPALLAAAESADLVVVGRRGHGAPLGIYLGSLARLLVREATCPVEISPQHPRHAPTVEERLLSDSEAAPQT
jgi:nucleotide-binding universal stress UspA family protein